ncbi:hypothetical protein MCOR27_008202 [Pyricularia oryzae]|nr:hypothetical protein MCOR19_008165 [Pyricularia oryzae]KAI6271967.1 hypothetical protein MCOR26_007568 [Pyricularia oryzae]KAI6272792.1 hypothetical protein MCOR27_008202 [Pyricularia oryzae]KAI6340142.1 hypothetical protein MCOR28_006831 [Pyricularia oryzae]KAI6391218.1 hypothetical protein MCOR23_009078 [Pyricularia oryzae]
MNAQDIFHQGARDLFFSTRPDPRINQPAELRTLLKSQRIMTFCQDAIHILWRADLPVEASGTSHLQSFPGNAKIEITGQLPLFSTMPASPLPLHLPIFISPRTCRCHIPELAMDVAKLFEGLWAPSLGPMRHPPSSEWGARVAPDEI